MNYIKLSDENQNSNISIYLFIYSMKYNYLLSRPPKQQIRRFPQTVRHLAVPRSSQSLTANGAACVIDVMCCKCGVQVASSPFFFCFDCALGLLSIFTPPLHNAVVFALHPVSASQGWILEPGDFDAELVRRGASVPRLLLGKRQLLTLVGLLCHRLLRRGRQRLHQPAFHVVGYQGHHQLPPQRT